MEELILQTKTFIRFELVCLQKLKKDSVSLASLIALSPIHKTLEKKNKKL